MPLPVPGKNDEKKEFMDKCLEQSKEEFRDIAQRYAVCLQRWNQYKGLKGERKQ